MNSIQVNRLQSLGGHKDAVYAVIMGGQKGDFFSAGGDGMVVKWNMDSPTEGELIARLPNSVYSIHYLRDSDLLVAGQNFEGIHLLDYAKKKELASLKIGPAHIFDIQSHNDNLLVAGGDGTLTVVNLNDWSISRSLKHSEKSARSIALNHKMNEMAIGYSDCSIRVICLDDYSLKKEWGAHSNSVFTVKYTPDGRYLLSGSRDAHLKVWDVSRNYQQVHDIVAHLYTINHIEFSPDNKHFVTCSMDKSIKVWDYEEFRLLKVIDKARHAGHRTSVNKLAWTSFSNQLVSASDDRTLSIWEIIF